MDRADLLVYQEGGTDFTVYTNRNASKVLKALQDGHIAGWQFDPEPSVQLPDGGVVRFAKREIRSTEETLVPCSVLYHDGAWELTGYALHRPAEVLHVATRWKKLGRDDGRYAIAAHLINADCSFDKNIDHGPIEGPGRFAALRIGESLIVSKTEPVAEWTERAEFLAVVLYDVDEKRNVDCNGIHPAGLGGPCTWLRFPLPSAESRSTASVPAP